MDHTTTDIKLTQFSRGAGCGCKIAPQVLEEILGSQAVTATDKRLLVGNDTRDDAAVYDLGNGTALISTTDFFMPVVDDAYDFGRIASANAISDVYAMGGKPLLAIAILGWPVEKLPATLAQQVLEGARAVCAAADIPLAGGHSIDAAEPVFGLAVNGIVDTGNLKRNNTAQEHDLLFLTKPLGIGVLSTAQKRGVLETAHLPLMIGQMTTLNNIGEAFGKIAGVTAMTDVTGFGLLGHLVEMAEGANLTAEISYAAVPVIDGVRNYISQRIIPDATYRNWNAYSTRTAFEKGVNVMEAFNLLPDPQTNGGLLFAVKEEAVQQVQDILAQHGLQEHIQPIGRFVAATDKKVFVKL